jgi:hypothetical protein
LRDVNLIMARFFRLLTWLVTNGRSLKAGILISIVITGPFLAQAFLPNWQSDNKTLPRTGNIAPNSQPIIPASSINTAPPILKFRDNFSYSSTSAMLGAGWIECGAVQPNYTTVSGGILTLENDGTSGAAVCWTTFPTQVHDWNVTTRGEWTSDAGNLYNFYGTLLVGVKTASHFYVFHADGFDYDYHLNRDGFFVNSTSGYAPTQNAWRTFGLAMKNHTLSMFIDGKVVLSYVEPDQNTDLTMVDMLSGWEATNRFDYVTATQLLPTGPDFLLYANPASQTLSYGTTATVIITLYSINNFNKTVALAVVGSNTTSSPVGFFTPPSISLSKNGTSTSTLTVPTTSLVNPQVSLIVTASSGFLSHQVTVSLSVTGFPPGQDIAITASPNNRTVVLPNLGLSATANYTITVTSLNGFNGTVMLQAGFNGNPGFSLSLTPTTVHLSPNGTATAILIVGDPGISANTSVNITGISIVGSHYVTVRVEFDPATFRIVGSPSARFVKTGLTASVALTVYSNSFFGSIILNTQISPIYLGGPLVSITPGSVYLTGSGSVAAIMTISTYANTPSGVYSVLVSGSNYATGSTTITVIVGPVPRLAGVTPGMRASYSLSSSSYTSATLGIMTTVTSVDGSNVTYKMDFLVNGYNANSTMSWIDVATGETSLPLLLPFSFVATNLNIGDQVYLGGAFSSFTITSKTTLPLLGANRLTISAHRSSSPAATIDSTWDASTGILYSLDATILLNSTYLSIHYQLLSTNAWTKLTSGFSQSPMVGPAPLIVHFTSDPVGGQTPYAYNWKFGDGSTSTSPNPTHRYATPGNYTVTLTVTDSTGDIVASSAKVTVSSPSQSPTLPQNMSQMIIELVIANYRTILAGVGGIWIILAGLAVFLTTRPKPKTAR